MKETKQKILQQALQLFNCNGFVNVRLQHIADATSISVGHLAYHLKNKDTIIETLYDQLKEQQQITLYEFRVAHLFEDLNRQLRCIFQLQNQYIFFYLDTLEILRAYTSIKEKHQQHIAWQIQQIEWMFDFNVFRGAFQAPNHEGQYKKLAWLFWNTMDCWMYYRQVTNMDPMNEEDFMQDVWMLMKPYFTDEGQYEFSMLSEGSPLPQYQSI